MCQNGAPQTPYPVLGFKTLEQTPYWGASTEGCNLFYFPFLLNFFIKYNFIYYYIIL